MSTSETHRIRGALVAAAVISAAVGLGTATPSSAATDKPITSVWTLNEGAGQKVHDVAGHRKNPGVLGATTAVGADDPTWIALPGKKKGALRFGGDDFVNIADSPTLEPQTLSVGAVVRATTPPGTHRYVVSKGALECESASYGLYTGTGGGLVFYVSNGSRFALSPYVGAEVWDGAWHTVLGTFDGTHVRLFVDGREVGRGTPTTVSPAYGLPTNDGFYIGDYRGTCTNSLGFAGDIDAVTIANRVITWSGE